MQISNGIHNGTHDSPGLLLRVNFFLTDLLIQLSSRQIFKHQIDIFFLEEAVVKLHYIGMADMLHDVNLSFQQNLLLFVHLLPISHHSYFFIIFIATILPVFLFRPFITFAKEPLSHDRSTNRLSRSRPTSMPLEFSNPTFNKYTLSYKKHLFTQHIHQRPLWLSTTQNLQVNDKSIIITL